MKRLSNLAIAVLLLTGSAHAFQKSMLTVRGKECRVKSNAPPKIAKQVAGRIDRFCKLFEEFYDGFDLEKRSDNQVRARVFASYDEYEAFRDRDVGPKPWSAYWSTSANAIVLYNDEADVSLKHTLFHEVQHQYLARFTRFAPKWLNEGLSEYFEGWRIEDDEDPVKRPMLFDLTILQAALRKGEFLAPRDLVAMDWKVFNEFADHYEDLHPSLHYATSWSIVYYCLELAPEEWRAELGRYLTALNAKGDRGQDAEFVVEDWDAFEEAWKTAILALEPKSETLQDHLLLASGHRQSRHWSSAIAELEKALALSADEPGVRYWIGYCTKRTGNYDAAIPLLEAAHESDDEDPRPSYMLSRIHAGIDKKNAVANVEAALVWAETTVDRTDAKNAFYLAFLADRQFASGDSKAALKSIKKAIKLVDDDELEARYKERQDAFK